MDYIVGKCGGLTEVNNKGSYIWDGTDETLPCNFNEVVVAVAKCICDDDTVSPSFISRLYNQYIRSVFSTLTISS